ncbi:MAG: hypothetical protein ACD_46C00262G0021 [uncultured bacterium]|nr:MAG: hypothetical protein ACD_46C00262G0021 [uncultured bacterium]
MNNQNSELRNIISLSNLEGTIDIHKILRDLYHYKLIILLVSFCTTLIAFLYTFTIQPQYKTSALIQLNPQSGNSIVNSLGLRTSQSSITETELALIRTRYILEPVIRENNLNIKISADYFPVFGEWMARHYQDSGLAKPFLGLKSYAWGGEKVQIKYFTVPSEYEGQNFQLIVGKNDTYQLYLPEKNLVLTGRVGERAVSHSYPGVALFLTTLKAHPGTDFVLSNQSPTQMVNQLSRQLHLKKVESDTSSELNQDTGIIQLQLVGSDPEQIKHILNAIVNYSIEKNIQLKSREAQKTLDFLHQRLPDFKKGLERVENALNQYHARSGTLSMSITSQLLIQELNNVIISLDKLKAQKKEILQIYTPLYPQVIAVEQQQKELEEKLQEIKKQITNFPAARQEEINLERDVKIKTKMYESLLSNLHQLEIVKAGLVGDIIALDNATPSVKESSNKLSIILVGFFIGLWLSTIMIIIKSVLTKTIEDSDKLENELQIPVKAIVPFSNKQKQLEKISTKGVDVPDDMPRLPLILAQHDPKDISVESLQSLRISLYITHSSTHHVIAIMGSLSGIGKSFVSLNLAQVLADSGKRTLLIDADIRKGRLHRAFFQAKNGGLSEYLAGDITFEDSIRHIHDNLFFIPCGNHLRHPIELLKSSRVNDLIQRARSEFDQVIVDTSPILPVIDAILITQYCDTKLFVVGGSSDQFDEVKQAVKKAQAHGINIDGFVFNHCKPIARYGAKKYAYYRYGT